MNNVEQAYKSIQADKKIAAEIRKAGPFESLVLVAKTRNAKHAISILNAFNKLLTNDAVEQNQVKDIIDALAALAHTNQDVQLKVLQTLPLLFSSSGKAVPSGSNLPTCLDIPIQLLEVPGIVGSIASATLQQLLVSLFDNPSQSREADVLRIFEDLCASFSQVEAGFVSFRAVKQPLILELVESILVADKRLFSEHPSLLDGNLLPIIDSLVTKETTPHVLLIRSLRLTKVLIPTKPAFLAQILQYLPKAPYERQVLLLETLESCGLEIAPDQFSNVISALLLFEDSLPGLGTYSICAPPIADDEQFTSDGLMYTATSTAHTDEEGYGEWCRPTRQLISQIHATECPRFQSGYKPLLICSILSIVSQSPEPLWRDSLILHSAVLSSRISLKLESAVLSDIVALIVKLDKLEEKRPRDLYLRRLGRIAVSSSMSAVDSANPVASSGSLGEPVHRSFACLHAYLGVITNLRNSFNVRGWAQALDILRTADGLLSMRSRGFARSSGSLLGTVMIEDRPAPSSSQAAAEMSKLATKIDDFFQTTDLINHESFADLIEAICTMHAGVPGSPLTATPTTARFFTSPTHRRQGSLTSMASFANAPSVETSADNYPLERLKQVVTSNISRFTNTDITCGWNTLLTFLSNEVRADHIMAAEILGTMIVKAIQHGLQNEVQQHRFVFALEALYGDGETLLIQLETLASIMEILGHELLCGWELVLQILYSSITQGPASTPEVVRLGFSCLHLICSDLLQSIPEDQTALLIETIVGYCSQREALNISLSAVGHFWTMIAALPRRDFTTMYKQYPTTLSRPNSAQENDLIWLLLMENLNHIVQDDRPEVRNSAIQACFRTLNTTESIGPNIWLSSIYLLLQHIQSLPFLLDPESAGYIETINSITHGSGKVMMAAVDAAHPTEQIQEIWSICLEYFKVTSIRTRVECASTALAVILQVTTAYINAEGHPESSLEDPIYRSVIDTGRGILQNGTAQMSQEGIATYLSLLLELTEAESLLKQVEQIEECLQLIFAALAYERSPLYYLDVDHLSNSQKPALALITRLLERNPAQTQSILLLIARLLELATTSKDKKDGYPFVSQKSSNWDGRPTFVAFTMRLLELLPSYYHLHEDKSLEALAALLRALNGYVETRFIRPSFANKLNTHRIWEMATNQIIHLTKDLGNLLDKAEADKIWDELLFTARHLFTSQPQQSEEFVLASLNSLRGTLSSRLGDRGSAYIEQYVEALYQGSCFFEQAEMIEPSTIPSTYYPDQIIREWCFLELCKMSIQHHPVCENVTLPWTIKRAQNILYRYNNNAQLRANAPLPRIEYAELLLLLDHLSDDTIHHHNQEKLLKSVYILVVEALLVSQKDEKVLRMLKSTLMRVGELLK